MPNVEQVQDPQAGAQTPHTERKEQDEITSAAKTGTGRRLALLLALVVGVLVLFSDRHPYGRKDDGDDDS